MRAFIIAVAITGALAYPVHALESDREQPIRVSADTVDVNQKTGTSNYRGNVVLIQGTLRIEAAEVRVNMRDNEIVSVSAKGRPLRFQQKLDKTGEQVNASARRMEYNAQKQQVDLYDRVTFRQGADVFNSPVVHYNLATTQLTAEGGKSAERVHSVIQPKRKAGAAAPTAAAPPAATQSPATEAENPPAAEPTSDAAAAAPAAKSATPAP